MDCTVFARHAAADPEGLLHREVMGFEEEEWGEEDGELMDVP